MATEATTSRDGDAADVQGPPEPAPAAAPPARRRLRRLPDRAVSGVVVAALVAMNLTSNLLATPWWLRTVEGGALLGFGRLSGLSWARLGLGRDRMRSGCRWGLGVVGVVTVVYVAGVLLPPTRPAFQDSRYHLPLPDALFAALVVIPLGTVLPEEIAFRSVLWGALARHSPPRRVLLTTSGLFGLWHVLPSLRLGSANAGVSATVGRGGDVVVVAAAVAFTALGGLVFGELRRRSDSVLAAAGAHWATNGLGVLFGQVAWHLSG